MAIGRHLVAAFGGFRPATARTSVYLDASFDAVSMMSGVGGV